jgi:hypothetical protein
MCRSRVEISSSREAENSDDDIPEPPSP